MTEDNYKIFVFRAIDEPELCQQYINGHVKVLTDYGITNVSTNNSKWKNHPYIYCAIAKNTKTEELVGGVRIQISDGVHPLPVEAAVGYMDPNIYEKVKEYAFSDGISESCGLWTAKSVKGLGVARYLMRASVASSDQLGFSKMLGICGYHTMKLFNEIGFVVDKSLGKNGDFLYPTKEHIANVIGILDAVTLKYASKNEQRIMLNLRQRLDYVTQEIIGNNKITLEYDIKYKNITPGPYLSEDNYSLNLIMSSTV